MAFQPAPNCVGVEIRCDLFGERVENTLNFELPGTPTASEVQEIAEQIEGWFVTSLLPGLSNQLFYVETYARSLHSASAPEFTANTNAGDPGGQTSPGLPANVTWCVKFLTGLTGRSYRGRNYMVGLCENQVVGNTFDSTAAANFVAAYEDILTIQAGFDWVWIVLSRQQNNVVLTNAVGAPVIGVGYTDLFIDSQRRRLSGRGD